jgi:putative heme-binding domain-containing protein
VDRILKLVDDNDPQVALQLAYSLGELNDPRQADALARLATKHPEEPYILAGVWSSVDQSNVGPVVGAILASAEKQPLPPTLMRSAIRLITELGDDDDLLRASKSIRVDDETQGADWRFAAAAELLEQSRRRSASVSGLLAQFAPMIDKARETLTAGEDDESQQLAALRILSAGGAKSDELLELLTPLLEPQNSPAVQQAAIELVAVIGGKEAANALLAPWPGYTSAARAQAFDVLFGSAELTSILLDRIDAGEISAADLDALQRQRLTTHPDKTLRDRATAALTNALDSDRDAIVKQYVSAVNEIRSGDAGRGRQLFAKHCSSCHRLEDQGHEVGPDLAALTSRAPAALIESILDPNRAVDERYRSYSALTIDGLAHAGILTSETSTSITLTEQQGKKQTLLRSELDAFANTGKSLMPEGLERDLTPPDVADVVAYLAAAGLPAKKIDGNEPRPIAPDYDGSLWLLAENAHIFGHKITYEKPHRNIGFWHNQKDFVAWDVEATTPGEYEVYLHWACINEAAGSAFIIEGGEHPIIGETAGTGGYDRFLSRRIGRVRLNAGTNRITVRPNGPLKTVNLMDLRGVYLTPVGIAADRAITGQPPRQGGDAATAIAKLVDGLAVGRPEEYQRIPKIWEEAIAAGRRNEKGELLRVIDLSLPKLNERLADWQAVVIGGGVVNGVSQAGEWPERRVSELLKEYPSLRARWDRTLKLAASMAVDQKHIKIGTRYDAFRILGAGKWEDFGEQLVNCLQSERNAELQMGAVSAIGDIKAEQSTRALIASLAELANENRQLAIEALLRTPERSKALLNAINKGEVSRDLLTEKQKEKIATVH